MRREIRDRQGHGIVINFSACVCETILSTNNARRVCGGRGNATISTRVRVCVCVCRCQVSGPGFPVLPSLPNHYPFSSLESTCFPEFPSFAYLKRERKKKKQDKARSKKRRQQTSCYPNTTTITTNSTLLLLCFSYTFLPYLYQQHSTVNPPQQLTLIYIVTKPIQKTIPQSHPVLTSLQDPLDAYPSFPILSKDHSTSLFLPSVHLSHSISLSLSTPRKRKGRSSQVAAKKITERISGEFHSTITALLSETWPPTYRPYGCVHVSLEWV